MSQAFTGFPSRAGHFGIRRLNVSFGLGPHGTIGSTVSGGLPRAAVEEERLVAVAEEADLEAAAEPEAPVAASQQLGPRASLSERRPVAEGRPVGPTTKKCR